MPQPSLRRGALAASVAALVGALPACTSTDATMGNPPGVHADPTDITLEAPVGPRQVETPGDYREWFEATLSVQRQTTDGTWVGIETASVESADGWVVVHGLVEGAAPGEILGRAPLAAAGPQDDVVVPIEPPLEPGRHRLLAVIYQDAEPLGILNVPGVDEPVTDRRDDIVNEEFVVRVKAADG